MACEVLALIPGAPVFETSTEQWQWWRMPSDTLPMKNRPASERPREPTTIKSGRCFSAYSSTRSTGFPSRSTVSTDEIPCFWSDCFSAASIERAASIVATTVSPGGISIPYAPAMTGMAQTMVIFAPVVRAISTASASACFEGSVPS